MGRKKQTNSMWQEQSQASLDQLLLELSHEKKKKPQKSHSVKPAPTEYKTEPKSDALWILSTRTGMLHYKDCEHIKRTYKEHCVPQKTLNTKLPFCPYCEKQIIISYGAEDRKKQMKKYLDLFAKHRVGAKSLFAFYVAKRAKTVINGNFLYVAIGNESWKINMFSEQFELYHNNYCKGKNNVRYERSGFHRHERTYDNLWSCLKYIMNYRYDDKHYK